MYQIRVGGTSNFISKIDPNDKRCVPPGSVETVSGWENPESLRYKTQQEARAWARMAEAIEGFSTSIEKVPSD